MRKPPVLVLNRTNLLLLLVGVALFTMWVSTGTHEWWSWRRGEMAEWLDMVFFGALGIATVAYAFSCAATALGWFRRTERTETVAKETEFWDNLDVWAQPHTCLSMPTQELPLAPPARMGVPPLHVAGAAKPMPRTWWPSPDEEDTTPIQCTMTLEQVAFPEIQRNDILEATVEATHDESWLAGFAAGALDYEERTED